MLFFRPFTARVLLSGWWTQYASNVLGAPCGWTTTPSRKCGLRHGSSLRCGCGLCFANVVPHFAMLNTPFKRCGPGGPPAFKRRVDTDILLRRVFSEHMFPFVFKLAVSNLSFLSSAYCYCSFVFLCIIGDLSYVLTAVWLLACVGSPF